LNCSIFGNSIRIRIPAGIPGFTPTVFSARSKGAPRAGDDAAAVRVVRPEEIAGLDFAFDHKRVLEEFLAGTYHAGRSRRDRGS